MGDRQKDGQAGEQRLFLQLVIACFIYVYLFCVTLLYCLICCLYVFIGFRQRNLGSRQALARLSLAKKGFIHVFYIFLLVFDRGT